MDHKQAKPPGTPWGELLQDPRHLRGDLVLLRRAIREGWPVPEESRAVLMERVLRLLDDPEAIPTGKGTRIRVVLQACRVALAAENANTVADLQDAGLPLGPFRPHRRTRRA